jgi:hypothetical protein
MLSSSRKPSNAAQKAAAATAPRVFNRWDAKVLARAGLSDERLSDAALKALQDRSAALNFATFNYRCALFSILLLPGLGFLFALPDTDGNEKLAAIPTLALICCLIGLFKSEEKISGSFADEEERKIIETWPVIIFGQRRYDARLFRRSCWIILCSTIACIAIAGYETNIIQTLFGS